MHVRPSVAKSFPITTVTVRGHPHACHRAWTPFPESCQDVAICCIFLAAVFASPFVFSSQADGSMHPSDDMENDVHVPLLSDPALKLHPEP